MNIISYKNDINKKIDFLPKHKKYDIIARVRAKKFCVFFIQIKFIYRGFSLFHAIHHDAFDDRYNF
jgi:hypothetical protein